MKRLKIILFAPTLNYGGGTERVLVNLANHFSSKGWQVVIIVDEIGIQEIFALNELIVVKEYWLGKINNNNPKSIFLKIVNKYLGSIFLNIFLKKHVVNSNSVIICFSNYITLNCYKTSFKHSLIAFEHWPYWITEKNVKLRNKINKIYPRLIKIVVLTNHEKKVYNSIGCKNVEIIPNAYSFMPESPAKLDNKIVLSIGHFNEQKRRDLLISSWNNINKKHPEWKLVIVGKGHLKGEVVKQINDLGLMESIIIKDPTTDIMNCYLNASIYLMTSEYEALPMVLIEAKVCGLPCVSFDIISGPKEIIQNGKDGDLADFPNTIEIAEKVNSLIDQDLKRKEYGFIARNDALKRFDPEKIYNQWEELFENL